MSKEVINSLKRVEALLKDAARGVVVGGADLGEQISRIGPINSFWRKTEEVLVNNASLDERAADLAEQLVALCKHVEMIRRGLEKSGND